MSAGNSDSNSTAEDSSQDSPKKAYTKMDPIRKLRIIYALDNGQSKTDIAREYGVHPQTISYIYKQKDSIMKKYSHKYNLLKEVRCVNLDQSLIVWLTTHIKTENVATEAKLREKALETMNDLNEEFPRIDDWLADFITRHNVAKHTTDIKCSPQAKEAWVRLQNSMDPRDLYIGSTCALLHTLSFDNFVNGQCLEDYMSLLVLVNSTGCDKKMLAVVGKESLHNQQNIKSLPVNYYHCRLPLVDNNVISNYLDKWNTDLKSKGRNVVLVMNLSDNIAKTLCFSNIKLISSNMDFATKTMEKIIECLKYHYRKLQITRNTIYAESYQFSLLDYIDMISAAWHNVPGYFTKQLFIPETSLYFKINDDDFLANQSLYKWCRTFKIPIDPEYSNAVDEFIYCDKKLQCLNFEQLDHEDAPNEFKPQNGVQSTSGIEAYQAMKRLVSYLQGECARASSIHSAKLLENHLECGALSEIKDIVSCINDNDMNDTE